MTAEEALNKVDYACPDLPREYRVRMAECVLKASQEGFEAGKEWREENPVCYRPV